MPNRVRDSQRRAVYRWEQSLDGNRMPLSLTECRQLVERIWSDYHPTETPPLVLDGRGRRTACGSRWTIKLPRWSRNPIILCHEVTHSLVPEARHGPLFATLVLQLWSRYADVDKVAARKLGIQQRPRRVRFAPLKDCPRPVGRDYRRWKEEREKLLHELKTARAKLQSHDAARPRH